MNKQYTYRQANPLLRKSTYLLKPNIAGFRILENLPFLHGFTYGKGSQNMSYKWEPGFLDEATREEATERVKERIEHYLLTLGMSPITDSIFLQALSGDTRIIDASKNILKISEHTDRGYFIQGGALFTTLPRTPIMMTSGDCHTLTIFAINKLGIPVTGLIHAGRRELDAELPRNALAHLIMHYACDPMDVHIGIVQGIGPDNHVIQEKDMQQAIQNPAMWQPYIRQHKESGHFHLDNLQLLLEQIKSVYIPGKNVEAYATDNYVLAQNGKSFSHRARQGRILITSQLL